MFQVIMCDHMRDHLSQEILVEYGSTKEIACEKAWYDLKAELRSVI